MTRASVGWPDAGEALLRELRSHRGRIALIPDGPYAQPTLESIAQVTGQAVTSVGEVLTQGDIPLSPEEIPHMLRGAALLADCEILFTPELGLDPLQLFRGLSRHGPLIAAWPGVIDRRRAVYSEPPRRDHFEAHLSDTLILRPRLTEFPDEIPYDTERVP